MLQVTVDRRGGHYNINTSIHYLLYIKKCTNFVVFISNKSVKITNNLLTY